MKKSEILKMMVVFMIMAVFIGGNYSSSIYPINCFASAHKATEKVFICSGGSSAIAPPGIVIVYDNRTKLLAKYNGFKVQGSCHIIDEVEQKDICDAIIEYNNENLGEYNWNRSVETMLVEWDWHNFLYNHDIVSDKSVNIDFDMGQGTDSTNPFVQIGGYIYEKLH